MTANSQQGPAPQSLDLTAAEGEVTGGTQLFQGDRSSPDLPLAPALPGYDLQELLGRGGMGIVYRATQARLHRVVAVKMILAGAHAGAADQDRFRAEAEALARLQHPGIVQIHEVGEHQGLPFLCLEYCPGGSLKSRLRPAPCPHAPPWC
jgi:serine/threonine protein kinase